MKSLFYLQEEATKIHSVASCYEQMPDSFYFLNKVENHQLQHRTTHHIAKI